MYKLIKILILFFIGCCSAFCQSNEDSVIIKNQVKEVRIFDSKNKLVSKSTYDARGNMIFHSKDNFSSATFLQISSTNTYDEKNHLIKSVSTHSSYTEPKTKLYEYDKNNNLINITDEKGNLIFEFFYDDKNFKTKEILYASDKTTQTTSYEREDNGKKVVEKMSGGFLEGRINISYFDENNNEIKIESYQKKKLRFSALYFYEKNLKTKVVYNETEGQNGNYFFYDSKNRLIKRQLFRIKDNREILGNYELFSYDENDLIVTYIGNIYSFSLNEYRYEYSFYN